MTRAQNIWLQLLAANWWTDLGGQLKDRRKNPLPVHCQIVTRPTPRPGNSPDRRRKITTIAAPPANSPPLWPTSTPGLRPEQQHAPQCDFRNAQVTEAPVTVYDTGYDSFPSLLAATARALYRPGQRLRRDGDPHNSNLSGGRMFNDPGLPRSWTIACSSSLWWNWFSTRAPRNVATTACAAWAWTPWMSNVISSRLPPTTSICWAPVNGEVRTEQANAVPLEQFARRNMVR